MTSVKYKLDNLCLIVDCNKLQLTGPSVEIMGMNYESVEQRFRSFGFNTVVVDGHDIDSLIQGFNIADHTKEVPTVIIAKTIKGKGVSFMENELDWHGKAPDDEELKKAIDELMEKV